MAKLRKSLNMMFSISATAQRARPAAGADHRQQRSAIALDPRSASTVPRSPSPMGSSSGRTAWVPAGQCFPLPTSSADRLPRMNLPRFSPHRRTAEASRIRNETSSSEAVWQEKELSATTLPDKRLAHRLRQLLDQPSAAPGKPIPAARGNWMATKVFYRFFDNPRMTEYSGSAGHFATTTARVAANKGPILILQDTTEFICNRAQRGKSASPKPSMPGATKPGSPRCRPCAGF